MDLTVHPELKVSLADYTWLPAQYAQVFQATLEKDDGLATIHFTAEIERCFRPEPTPGSTTQGQGHIRSQSQFRILILSRHAIYLCTEHSEITRCIHLENIEEVQLLDDWICLGVPRDGYDLLFRVSPRNLNTNCHQQFFLEVLNALRLKVVGPHSRKSVLTPRNVSNFDALLRRPLNRPHDFDANSPSSRPIPIPITKWEDLVKFHRADVTIRALLSKHRAICDSHSPSHQRQYNDHMRQLGQGDIGSGGTLAEGIASPFHDSTSPIRRQADYGPDGESSRRSPLATTATTTMTSPRTKVGGTSVNNKQNPRPISAQVGTSRINKPTTIGTSPTPRRPISGKLGLETRQWEKHKSQGNDDDDDGTLGLEEIPEEEGEDAAVDSTVSSSPLPSSSVYVPKKATATSATSPAAKKQWSTATSSSVATGRSPRPKTTTSSGTGLRTTKTSGATPGPTLRDSLQEEERIQQRFEDPCLEMVWSELLSQRKILEKLTSQVGVLMLDRYPYAYQDPNNQAAASMTGLETSQAPQHLTHTSAPVVATSNESTTGARRNAQQQQQQEASESSPKSEGGFSSRRPRPRREVKHTDLHINTPVEQMTPFQRSLVSKFLYEGEEEQTKSQHQQKNNDYGNHNSGVAGSSLEPTTITTTSQLRSGGSGALGSRGGATPPRVKPKFQGTTPKPVVGNPTATAKEGMLHRRIASPYAKQREDYEQRQHERGGAGGPLLDESDVGAGLTNATTGGIPIGSRPPRNYQAMGDPHHLTATKSSRAQEARSLQEQSSRL